MDSTSPTFGTLSKTFVKILRLRQTPFISGNAALGKQKLSENFNELSADPHNEIELLVANLFAGVSAFKAAYAQLQLAHEPCDPDLINFADRSVVTQLKRLSELKQGFLNRAELKQSSSRSQAQVQEQRNLLKTYKIITAKLESELQAKESQISSLQSELRVAEKQCRTLETRLRPGRTLAALDDLHLSGLNPTHFLTLLRSTVKSIRFFVKIMVREMKSAGWDLTAAAGVIQPLLRRQRNTNHNIFAFQSHVSRVMFSNFQRQCFGWRSGRARRSFFSEFTELKFVNNKQSFERQLQFRKFCRGKYLGLVHPKMEASFFGNLEQRKLVSSGMGSPETNFFEGFAEMARRVWLLHCLFFSFKEEDKGVIFQAMRGSRFSELYMESVAEEEDEEGNDDRRPAVGFTVLPGFRVGRTVVQCRVYLAYM
ncbi:LOW QUALITY PROTEIN: uncharacterized protein LOC110029675 [Phalaenopsis equestris]|uniref:LOW QUALITY PROTEIN: uncharacterized protein LOC110029675 n=1 Tax=Phalaenopsis equestris TaxID=78828 RepID=UPI0009E33E0A|nr:LOW QUALITY PROTEIN: uncharacterized protein LOC110029675 [Phalaenopsis equestris]